MSDEPIDAELSKISQRILYWRQERGLSRQELAELSGVAASTVHKVETQQMIPSIAVVLKLAHGLGRRPAEIMAESETEVTIAVQRAGDRQTIVSPSGRFERLTAELAAGEMEVWRVSLEPAASSGGPLRFDGEVFVACDRGQVTVEIAGQSNVLGEGDVAHFKATHPFTYRNDANGPARFLLVATLPSELRSVVQAHAAAGTGT
jgi:transcriptional regulator with XRE-family HTH domain